MATAFRIQVFEWNISDGKSPLANRWAKWRSVCVRSSLRRRRGWSQVWADAPAWTPALPGSTAGFLLAQVGSEDLGHHDNNEAFK